MKRYDIVIVGGGCAGLTAAIYARRAQKSVLLFENNAFGGQISTSAAVENFPGHERISGSDFSNLLLKQVTDLGTETRFETVRSLEDRVDGKLIKTDTDEYSAGAVILATGLRHRKTGLTGEDKWIGRGISYCAVCDGAFYRGKSVAVLGGGNTALHDALYLSDICQDVTVIHRRDSFRDDAEASLKEAVFQKSNIRICFHSVLTEINGDKRLSSLTIVDTKTVEKSFLNVSGLFVAIGLIPENKAFAQLVELDQSGYIRAGEDCKTSCNGVFAAGDCRTKELRQLTTAAADGAVAATNACRYLETLKSTAR